MHDSVLKNEAIEFLNIRSNKIYLDMTFGAGGHSKAILKSNDNCKVVAFDRDSSVIKYAKEIENEFPNRFQFINSNFSNAVNIIKEMNLGKFDGILYDLGVSSMQLDNAKRGFSFNKDARLDMRMNQNSEIDAYHVINNLSEQELANIIYKYGDEKKSRLIAREIIKVREKAPIETTLELANIIKKFVHHKSINPATKTFQAIRIFINDELKEIESSLNSIFDVLNNNARIVIISFHSLEDRIVKYFFKTKSNSLPNQNRKIPVLEQESNPDIKIITRKAIVPNSEEVKNNIRARSAKMRVAEYL